MSAGTGIPACILVIDKAAAGARRGVFMIDASPGFLKDGNKNRLRAQDIHRIVDVFNRQIELPRYSRMVPVAEIGGPANEYNLNIPRYVGSSEPEDLARPRRPPAGRHPRPRPRRARQLLDGVPLAASGAVRR